MTVQQSIPDVKPGDYVVYTKGKSKSLLRGIPYKVTNDYKAGNVKGRGLTFSKFDKFNPSEYHTWYSQNRLQKFLFKTLNGFGDNIRKYNPNLMKDTVDLIYITDEKTNERVSLKTGRALRKVFPELPDAGIETLVDLIKTEFGPPEVHFTMTNDPEEISSIMRTPLSKNKSSFYTGIYSKNLSNSCMKRRFSHLPLHPYCAYGAKDFQVIFTKDAKGHLSGRCVTIPDKQVYFPVYAQNKITLETIQDKIKNLGINKQAHDTVVEPVKMYSHKYQEDYVLTPYFDRGFATFKDKELYWTNNNTYVGRYTNTRGYTYID